MADNHNKRKQHNEPMKTRSKYTRNGRQPQQNACDQVAIGFGFASDWLRRWREFYDKPITERCKAKPKQFRIPFDSQLKTENRCSVLYC